MTRPVRLLLWGLVPAAVVLVWLGGGARADRPVLDLLESLPDATLRPSADGFSVIDATLDGTTHRALLTTQASRATWQVEVPARSWLRLAIGLREDAWTIEGDGVLFQVGVSDGQAFDELFSLVVNPYRNPADRGWHELVLDLDGYAGRTVDVILNTRSGPPDPPSADTRGDLALWGVPRIVTR